MVALLQRQGLFEGMRVGVLVRNSEIMARVAASTASCQQPSPNRCRYSGRAWAKMMPRELLMIAPSPRESNAAATSS